MREITPDGTIHLIAGNGTEGYRGEFGGPAARAELDSPQGVAVNAKGDVFIADTYNNVIREVTPRGFISTYAGNGTAGYRGDNGPAWRAELSSPTGLAVDALGNLYIADSGNNVIRRVSTNGSHHDGGRRRRGRPGLRRARRLQRRRRPATPARLNSPAGRRPRPGRRPLHRRHVQQRHPRGDAERDDLDPGQHDRGQGEQRQRRPGRAAKLNTPFAVAVDASTADLYIADTSNNKVRVVTRLRRPDHHRRWPGGPGAPHAAPAPPPLSTPCAIRPPRFPFVTPHERGLP